jgi:hypothetical protein
MADYAETVQNAISQVTYCDPMLTVIDLLDKQVTAEEANELADCLFFQPDVALYVHVGGNELTDDIGIKFAQYVAASSKLMVLDLTGNKLGPMTYLAVAAALQINTSLISLHMHGNFPENKSLIDAAFVAALRLNPNRFIDSEWQLYSTRDEFQRLRSKAEELGHPSLQLLLCAQLDRFTFETLRHF